MGKRQGSIISAIFWMFFLSILLIWLPVFGPLIAGYVGGKKAGGAFRGLLACLIPAIIFSWIIVSFAVSIVPTAILVLIGGSITILVLAVEFPLVCGAIVGGALAK